MIIVIRSCAPHQQLFEQFKKKYINHGQWTYVRVFRHARGRVSESPLQHQYTIATVHNLSLMTTKHMVISVA